MTWCWLTVTPAGGALPAAAGREPLRVVPLDDVTGAPAGALALWPPDREGRPSGSVRVDARVAGEGGPATWLSLVMAAGTTSLPFDDPMVTAALRRRLAGRWPTFVSTLLVDWARIAGAITAGYDRASVEADPFAALFPRRLLRIPAGSLGEIPAPTGPGVTRYGSGNPWPWDRYAGQVD